MITKQEFSNILNNDADNFIAACRRWMKTEFSHSYSISKSKDRKKWNDFNSGSDHWKCNSIINASEKYYWNGKNKIETDKEIIEIGDKLRKTFIKEHQKDFVESCLEVMKWGGVATQNGLSLLELHLENRLIDMAGKSINIMNSDNPDLSCFGMKECIMTSGYSKIYSLLGTGNLFIYDSRVATGIGILLRKYYGKFSAIPEELRFPRSESRTGGRVVQFKDDCKQPGFQSNYKKYAEWNIKFNWLLEKIVPKDNLQPKIGGKNLILREDGEKMLAIEQALFMIGYSVGG